MDKFTCMELVQRCVLLILSLLVQKATEHFLDNPRGVEEFSEMMLFSTSGIINHSFSRWLCSVALSGLQRRCMISKEMLLARMGLHLSLV